MEREELVLVGVCFPRAFLVRFQVQMNKLQCILVAKLDYVLGLIFDGVYLGVHFGPAWLTCAELSRYEFGIFFDGVILVLVGSKALLVMQDIKMCFTHIFYLLFLEFIKSLRFIGFIPAYQTRFIVGHCLFRPLFRHTRPKNHIK